MLFAPTRAAHSTVIFLETSHFSSIKRYLGTEFNKTIPEYMSEDLASVLANEANLIHEASEALPHQFSTCTYSLGYIRQAVYLCLTCNLERGICSSCSIACHTDHEQLELFPKRHFRCDCPTSSLPHSCTLHTHLELANEENSYNQNFRGVFCRCGRPYDAKTERETMIQCTLCEVGFFFVGCLSH